MNDSALLSARVAARHTSGHCAELCPTGSSANCAEQPSEGVGRFWHDLSPGDREAAIELAELKEIWFDHEGFHAQAQDMRDLAEDLRSRRGEKA